MERSCDVIDSVVDKSDVILMIGMGFAKIFETVRTEVRMMVTLRVHANVSGIAGFMEGTWEGYFVWKLMEHE